MAVKQRLGEDDNTFDARCYRERLRREINMHVGTGRSCQPAPKWIRRARASYIYEQARGHGSGTMSIDEIIEDLIRSAYGDNDKQVEKKEEP